MGGGVSRRTEGKGPFLVSQYLMLCGRYSVLGFLFQRRVGGSRSVAFLQSQQRRQWRPRWGEWEQYAVERELERAAADFCHKAAFCRPIRYTVHREKIG
jgi:hypothetical protein